MKVSELSSEYVKTAKGVLVFPYSDYDSMRHQFSALNYKTFSKVVLHCCMLMNQTSTIGTTFIKLQAYLKICHKYYTKEKIFRKPQRPKTARLSSFFL